MRTELDGPATAVGGSPLLPSMAHSTTSNNTTEGLKQRRSAYEQTRACMEVGETNKAWPGTQREGSKNGEARTGEQERRQLLWIHVS